ncbi:putative nucleotidyltransferase, ribonuclease H [Tanacetum coccineum]
MIACFDSIILHDLERLDVELCVRSSGGYWASMRIESNLMLQIKEAQREDGKHTEFSVDDDGVVWFEDRLCVPNDQALREKFTIHSRDPKFTSHFWKGLQKAWGKLVLRSVQHFILNDGSWDEYLCLVEFAYNNSWHASIKAAPFELLYGRKCRAPICWDEVGERLIEGPELIEITNEKVAVAKEKLKEARSRQKSYADNIDSSIHWVRLRIFGSIGEDSYRLDASPRLCRSRRLSSISLRGYIIIHCRSASYPFDQIQPDMSLSEEPESILDRQERVMRNKVIPFVKILWKNHPEREATWETEESMRASYPHFFV